MYKYLLLFLFLLTACAPPQPEREQTIRFGLESAPVTLDPRFATDAASARINRLIYRSLIDFDSNRQPIADLATWEQLLPTHYRFNLRPPGCEFHNDHTLNAYDVKATYDFILDPANASPHREAFKSIQEIDVINEKTIDFILSQPDNLFVGRLGIGILPADLIKQNHPFNTHPIGSGVFKFVDWQDHTRLKLQRLTDQQMVEFIEVKDPVVRVLKLLRGELDILQGDLSAELITWLGKRKEVQIQKEKGSNFAYLGFNLQNDTTSNLLIRQAIAYALNREDMIHYVLGDAARPASSILPPTHWAGHPELPLYPHDPEKAKQLLAQAGYTKDNPLKLSYKTSTNPVRIRLATVIQHQLKQVGIEMDLQTYDWGTFYGDIKAGKFQMYSLMWVEVKMPDIFEYVFHSNSIPPSGANRGRYINPQLDQWVDEARQTNDLQKQVKLYRQIQQQIFDDLPYVPLWYEDYVLVTQKMIEHYTLSADGNYDSLKWAKKVLPR
ncbi:ABC transporter substrate-binding protein [Candidatus Albibeggiatoa sp. nov. NOAA]|uniref:ABC transporter substrate-binding protein n=1 Tax=Candidatus Albibeggiatoa sp. nov. NOAA TaxID=3162724 RepID=UPI0032F61FD6|nr:ABC transporter substrate-binding protein [Thiotrichaceae bacterium]